MKLFNNVCIIGLGVIGSSIALSMRKYNLANNIYAICDNKTSEYGLINNIIDKSCNWDSLDVSCIEVDLIVLAVPIGAIDIIIKKIKPYINENTIIMDVCSTKQSIIQSVISNFNYIPPNFIFTHPIAGSEKSGIENSIDDLFVNKNIILTIFDNTNKNYYNTIYNMWKEFGANIIIMSASEHDKIFAYISHLPQLLSYLLLDSIPYDYLEYSGSGLYSMCRLANSNEIIWSDIFLNNKDNILSSIDDVENNLNKLKKILINNDNIELINFIKLVREKYARKFNKNS